MGAAGSIGDGRLPGRARAMYFRYLRGYQGPNGSWNGPSSRSSVTSSSTRFQATIGSPAWRSRSTSRCSTRSEPAQKRCSTSASKRTRASPRGSPPPVRRVGSSGRGRRMQSFGARAGRVGHIVSGSRSSRLEQGRCRQPARMTVDERYYSGRPVSRRQNGPGESLWRVGKGGSWRSSVAQTMRASPQ